MLGERMLPYKEAAWQVSEMNSSSLYLPSVHICSTITTYVTMFLSGCKQLSAAHVTASIDHMLKSSAGEQVMYTHLCS